MNHVTVKHTYNSATAEGTLLTKEDVPMIETLINATANERSKNHLAKVQPVLLLDVPIAKEFLTGILKSLVNGDVFVNANGGYTPVPNHLEIITIKDKIN